MATLILWSLFAYLLGSIPFAVLLGNLFARQNIRTVGDGNPGGTNTWKAAGWKIGLAAILLEISKGYLPVALASHFGISQWALIPVCLAPILGHATTPFLGFRGGKALSATGGVWVGLLGLWAFSVYAATALLLAVLREHAWAAMLGVSLFLGWAMFVEGELWMVLFGILNVFLIAWTHRRELSWPPRPRPWLVQLLFRRAG
jgi:glycerol-3-phosphate acyltransferase PlsY